MMLDSLWFSASAILPILLLSLIGFSLCKSGAFPMRFFDFLHKLVFRAALPALIFIQLYDTDFSALPEASFLLFCVLAMTVCYILGMVVSALFVKDRKKAGAFAQGMTRSTFSILGLPLAGGLFGEAGLRAAALLLPLVVIWNNAFAVIMLSLFREDREKGGFWKTLLAVLRGIVTNPLIIGMLLALLCKWARLTLPDFLLTTTQGFSAIAQPLALLCLGAGFAKEGLRGRVTLAVVASILKTIVIPVIFCGAAILLGFRGVDLGLVCILFGGPTTISSYIMAKNMHADEVLTGQIVLLSTLMSAVTLFFAFFFLRAVQLL